MIAVLARLHWMTLRGRVVRSIRLLRQPKYLVGFLVGAGWIALWILRPLLRSHFGVVRIGGLEGGEVLTSTIHRMAALFVTLFLPLPWLLPWGPLGLPFRESELTLLLQAPLTRRQIIQYGLLKSELGVIFGALLLSLARGGRGFSVWLSSFIGILLLFDLWHLNGRWRALFNLRQREVPAALARRRRVLLTLCLVAYYAVLLTALSPLPGRVSALLQEAGPQRIVASLGNLEWPSLLVALSAPAWYLTAPIFAEGATRLVLTLVPVVLALLLQRELVLRSKACFEEKALEQAKKRETRKSPTRRFARLSSRARATAIFELERAPHPALAILWKNLMRVTRVPWRRIALAAPVLLLALAVLPALLHVHPAVYAVLASFGGFSAIFLPLGAGMLWNNDLRSELGHLELVRPWPVSARRFLLSEVVASALPSLVGSVFGAGMVLAALSGSRLTQALTGETARFVLLPRSPTLLGVDSRLAVLLLFASLLPMAAAVSFVSAALQNLATAFVPAWMAHSADRSQGVAAFGQRMVFFTALALVLLVALIPSGLLVGALAFVQHLLGIPWSAWELPLLATLAAAPLFLAGWSIVELAARLWEQLDPAQEILEIGR